MKLVKCNHCGRPFYNSERKCPYCGSDASLSATNLVTRAISDPKSHRLMEEVLSGNRPTADLHEEEPVNSGFATPEPTPVHSAPVITADTADEEEPAADVDIQESALQEEPAPEAETPNTARAEAMANIAATAANTDDGDLAEAVDQVETVPVPRKRRWWIWILILVILLAAAAAVYLKWDFVYSTVTSLFK